MRLLLSGYYGFGNLGDEAILAALARHLQGRGHRVEVLSADPPATRARHGVAACHRLWSLPWALGRSDALLAGGGGLLQDATSRRSLRYYLGVLRAARAVGLRTVVFGQSIGPLSVGGREAVARALDGIPVAVRDAASRDLLADLGVPAAQVPDAALALAPAARAGGAGLLLIPRADVAGSRTALARLASIASDEGEIVTVAALQGGADEADADAVARAVPAARRRTFDGPDAALAACAAADAVVSVRLHGLIFAARAGTPHLGVAYDPKVPGFLAESGGEAVSVPVAPEALATAWRDRLRGRRRAAELGEALAARAEAGFTWLDRALGTMPA